MSHEINALIKRVKEYSNSISEKRLKEAYNYAAKIYEGHKRMSGDPVLQHATETAKILTTLKVDEETLIAALLHEVPEYDPKCVKEISGEFGKNIGVLISAYEKMAAVQDSSSSSETETLRKMCLVMAKDLRVVLIKLADRLHNMQTLEFLQSDRRKKIARETMDIFVPLASRLGVYRLRSIIEDLCFKFLHEKEYEDIKEQLKFLGKKKKNAIDEITNIVEKFLKANGVKGDVAGRYKNTYSIYKKLKKKGKISIDDIQDIFAIRIILPSQLEKGGNEKVSYLYELIGNFHNKWKPLPGRFKDYVGFPKPNGYRSLHTTVIGLAPHSIKEPVEIQIRTEKMHEEAEYGIAAHWLYKETKGNSEVVKKQRAQMDWIESLAKLSTANENNDDVFQELKVDLFQDRIFVFTPTGEVKDLPVGSTPIDFAYSIHSDVGNKSVMAKANGAIVPLDYELKNGEVVEIITRSNILPKLEWLSFVKTNGAKSKIKSYFRSFDQDQNFKEGKGLLNNKLVQLGKPRLDPKLTILKNINGERKTLKEREEIVRQVGSGSVLPSSVIRKVYSYEELVGKGSPKKVEVPKINIPKESEIGKHIIVGGAKGLPVRIARCCKPSFGQQIAGYINRGKAISVHKKGCVIYKASNRSRHIDAKWAGMPDDTLRQVTLLIETIPDTLIMREITKAIGDFDGNILHFYVKKRSDSKIIWEICLEVLDFTQFDSVLNKVSGLKGIKSVRKGS